MTFDDLIKTNYSNDELGDLRREADEDLVRDFVDVFLNTMAYKQFSLTTWATVLEQVTSDLWAAIEDGDA
jgi:hypothetical protein